MVSSRIEISPLGSGDMVKTNHTLQSSVKGDKTNKQANPTTCGVLGFGKKTFWLNKTVSLCISRHLSQPPLPQLSPSLPLFPIDQAGLCWRFPAHLSVPTGASCVWDGRLLTHPHCFCGLVNGELAPADQIQGRVNSKVAVAQMHACRRSRLTLTCKNKKKTFPDHSHFSFSFFPPHPLQSLRRLIHSRPSLCHPPADGEVCLTKWPTCLVAPAFVTACEQLSGSGRTPY